MRMKGGRERERESEAEKRDVCCKLRDPGLKQQRGWHHSLEKDGALKHCKTTNHWVPRSAKTQTVVTGVRCPGPVHPPFFPPLGYLQWRSHSEAVA